MSLREQKKQQTQQSILATASSLFRKQGFAGTSMDEIALSSNIARGTLFNYFASKDAIVLALAREFEEEYPQQVMALTNKPLPTQERIDQAFAIAASFFTRHRQLNEVIFMELVRIRNSQAGANDHVFQLYIRAFRQILQQGLQQGDVRDDIDIDSMAELLCSTMVSGIYFLFSHSGGDIHTTFSSYAKLLGQAVEARQ